MENWNYEMRNEMQCIVPNLYLGPYSCASRSKYEDLINHGITHIVCVHNDKELRFVGPKFEDFNYFCVQLQDHPSENILSKFHQVISFLNNSIENGGTVLVHGNAGLSRSATLVIAYVMKNFNMSYMEGMNLVRSKRFCISPNIGFIHQLKEFEPMCKAGCINDHNLVNNKKRKRGME